MPIPMTASDYVDELLERLRESLPVIQTQLRTKIRGFKPFGTSCIQAYIPGTIYGPEQTKPCGKHTFKELYIASFWNKDGRKASSLAAQYTSVVGIGTIQHREYQTTNLTSQHIYRRSSPALSRGENRKQKALQLTCWQP